MKDDSTKRKVSTASFAGMLFFALLFVLGEVV